MSYAKNSLVPGDNVNLYHNGETFQGTIKMVWGRKLGIEFNVDDCSATRERNAVYAHKVDTEQMTIRYMSKHQKYQGSFGGTNGQYGAPVVVMGKV